MRHDRMRHGHILQGPPAVHTRGAAWLSKEGGGGKGGGEHTQKLVNGI